MKKGEIYQGIVTRVDFPNKGIVEVDGEKVIVKNTMPGQKVEFQINKKKGGKCEGRLLNVIEKSELENNDNVCKHFGVCGGCTYQSMSYEAQLNMKEAQVKKILDSVCSDYEFEGITGSPITTGYRNKMEFSFGDEEKDGPLALGMHRRGSFYDVVKVDGCQIVDEDFRKILVATNEYFSDKGLKFYHKMRHEGYLRHLLVRKAKKTGEILVDLVTTTQVAFDLSEYAKVLCGLSYEGELVGILHTSNDSLSDVVANDATEILYGRDLKGSLPLFVQTPSLRAATVYAPLRSVHNQGPPDLVHRVLTDTQRGRAHIRDFAEKHSFFRKSRIFALPARKKSKYDKGLT